jgi:hypothetical protein
MSLFYTKRDRGVAGRWPRASSSGTGSSRIGAIGGAATLPNNPFRTAAWSISPLMRNCSLVCPNKCQQQTFESRLTKKRTSLRQSSPQKREFLRCGLETFGRFSPRLLLLGDWRLGTNAQKAYKMRQFRRVRAYSLWLREWLAVLGGIELRHSQKDIGL